MRLTHLKLAGFKSFVDPITIQLNSQRVGVVGPNGCGKSNVMESIRWVLGESSAKEMRGDSMDAVIFNGSSLRKPISRASVELIFDNSLGKSSGEWRQYAEISVKRVIERDKGSTYYINNSAVRRRDVADLFLGTGLGGRAYAIIGQNTISRIVEAKPDELRIFLEEAAGISKYKERRRETESRLRDTLENLNRVGDISRELVKQINRLASQASVTEQYHRLQTALKKTTAQVWLLKKRDAALNWEKTKRITEKLVTALESQMSALRNSENQLETLRQHQYVATESVQSAQANYYEANAIVSNLEQQVRYNLEAQERLNNQKNQLTVQIQKLENASAGYLSNLYQLETDLKRTNETERQANQHLQLLQMQMPEALQAQKKIQLNWQEAVINQNKAEQEIQLSQTNINFLNRELTLQQAQSKELHDALNKLESIDESELAQKQQELTILQSNIKSCELEIATIIKHEHEQINKLQEFQKSQTQAERSFNQCEAQINSIAKLQAALNSDGKISDWLKKHQLQDASILWQNIRVDKGWEQALEAVLGQRLNAILVDEDTKIVSRPAAPIMLAKKLTLKININNNNNLISILNVINSNLTVLNDWLAHVYIADTFIIAQSKISLLQQGECIVTRDGDVMTAYSVSYYAAQSSLHGVLERQRELDDLRAVEPSLRVQLSACQSALAAAEQALFQLRTQLSEQQQSQRNLTQQHNQINIALERLQQKAQYVASRQANIRDELKKIESRNATVSGEIQCEQNALQAKNISLIDLKFTVDNAQKVKEITDLELSAIQLALQQANSIAQENNFNNKLLNNNINELKNKVKASSEEMIHLKHLLTENEAALNAAKMDHLKQNLEHALTTKQSAEKALIDARSSMNEAEEALQFQERSRMQFEQLLHVERDKLEIARLNDQEARLCFEQCQLGFDQCKLSEADLLQDFDENCKVIEFERKSQRLNDEIIELGAVNLAATEELIMETERKNYLDAQVADLSEASTTLEDAIRKIDNETKSKLKLTFDQANFHFGALFSTLFNGGLARLELLGDDILDTGMQVVAQPPGKKNSTIHLLSGGEKALTAIALVFALFKLNPAPFCLMDEVDAPLDDSNTERFCTMVRQMSDQTQFMFVSHNKITMEMAQQLIGVTMQESGVSRIVDVDMDAAAQLVLEM